MQEASASWLQQVLVDWEQTKTMTKKTFAAALSSLLSYLFLVVVVAPADAVPLPSVLVVVDPFLLVW
jgi:uncharacterized membrane protein YbaN (DUF454 family)